MCYIYVIYRLLDVIIYMCYYLYVLLGVIIYMCYIKCYYLYVLLSVIIYMCYIIVLLCVKLCVINCI